MFLNTLKIEMVDEQLYLLLEDLKFQNELYNITVHKNFDFDAISIPKVLWSIVGSPLTGKVVRSAVVHDALYSAQICSRKECDKIFKDMMKADIVNDYSAITIFIVVRLFGWINWNKAKKYTEEYKKFLTINNQEG